ncbi:MAG: hypothetical protein IJ374_06445 [Lachnospiraceae bacterium]|nr:hypothetical protein [Lachnospiraceae bacterium]
MAGKEKIYIERQKNYTKQRGTFGPLGSISGCGCGAVALYNVLTYFGIKTDFVTIVNRFNRLWPIATSYGGFLGTSVFHLYRELKSYGFEVYPIIFTKETIRRFHLDKNSAFIFLYFWKKKRLGGHYQAGFGNADGTITLHNPKVTYFGILDLLKEKRKKEKLWFCLALMIRKKKK